MKPLIYRTNIRGIFHECGLRSFFVTNYRESITCDSESGDYRSSWLIGGLALNADPMEVKLESWEVGQLCGGN